MSILPLGFLIKTKLDRKKHIKLLLMTTKGCWKDILIGGVLLLRNILPIGILIILKHIYPYSHYIQGILMNDYFCYRLQITTIPCSL